MSTMRVEVVEIEGIEPHSNADRLDIALIKGWRCIVGKGNHKVGDKCVYFPIDCVLPDELVNVLFTDSKIQPNKGRIKTIKIRGEISQGLLIALKALQLNEDLKVGTDLAEQLKIVKYEPPEPPHSMFRGYPAKKRESHPDFHKYTDIENFKNYNKLFNENDMIEVTEKCHGTNARFSFLKNNQWFTRFLEYFGVPPKYKYIIGSHNIQFKSEKEVLAFIPGNLQDKALKKNVYQKASEQYDIKNKIRPNEIIYAEILGANIQKNYSYGCKPGEIKLVVFDVSVNGKYLNYEERVGYCKERDLPYVPILYVGAFNLEKVKELTKGVSVLCPEQPIREGVVIKMQVEESCRIGRKILKYVSDDYLMLKNNSDNH